MKDEAIAKYKVLRLLGLKHKEACKKVLAEYQHKYRKRLHHALIGVLIQSIY